MHAVCFPLVLALAPAPQEAPLTLAQKQEDLWSLVETLQAHHPEPFLRADEETWEEVLGEAAARIEESGDLGFYLELARVVALTHDGHTRLSGWARLRPRFADEARPLRFRTFADGLHVVAAPAHHERLMAARVESIEGTAIEHAFGTLLPYLPADNDHGARLEGAQHMGVPSVLLHLGIDDGQPGTSYGLVLANGSREVVSVKDSMRDAPPLAEWHQMDLMPAVADALWMSRRGENAWFEALTDELVYCQYNSVRDTNTVTLRGVAEDLFTALDERPGARLVIDLRHNGGGNNYLNQPLIHGLIRDRRFQEPGNLYVLTSPRTFSAAMNFSAAVEANTQALFVGEPTGSGPNLAGDSQTHTLPNSGIGVRVSELWWQGSDPRDLRRSIQPDLEAPMTFAAFAAGRDPGLEAALDHGPDPGPTVTDPNRRWRRTSQVR